jgi:integrase
MRLTFVGSRNFKAWLCDELRFDHEPLLKDINPDILEKYFGWRLEQRWANRKLSPATVNRERRILRAVFNRAIRKGVMSPPNPIGATDPIREIRRLKYIPSEAEILRFLREAKTPYFCYGPGGKTNGRTRERNPVFHDVALLISNTGLRLSEALYLEWSDVNLSGGHCQDGTLYVRTKELNPIKDREERPLPINDAVRSMLLTRRQLVKDCPWVFPNPDNKPHNRHTFGRDFGSIAKKAGVPQLTPQSLRRAFATLQAHAGVPAFILKNQMGHASVTTTEKFYIGGGAGAWVPRAIGG